MNVTMFDLAKNYIGVKELSGTRDHPLIQWWLSLCFDNKLDLHDEVPWCSAFVNGMAWQLNLPRSMSAMARSWMRVGRTVGLPEAKPGYDIVVLWRGQRDAPTGHVGLFSHNDTDGIHILGGNQSNSVKVSTYPPNQVLTIRRLFDEDWL